MSSASRPYAVVGSSIVLVRRLSKTSAPRPGAALPFSVNGLNLSKLVSRVGGTSCRSPPFGASGLTHSKCAKPFGYLMSPNCAYACAAHEPRAASASTTKTQNLTARVPEWTQGASACTDAWG